MHDHETSMLIGANKVEGTRVFNQSGEELGKIHEIMIDKVSGKWPMRSCHLAASWDLARSIARSRGRP
jgi:hypothetical protein